MSDNKGTTGNPARYPIERKIVESSVAFPNVNVAVPQGEIWHVCRIHLQQTLAGPKYEAPYRKGRITLPGNPVFSVLLEVGGGSAGTKKAGGISFGSVYNMPINTVRQCLPGQNINILIVEGEAGSATNKLQVTIFYYRQLLRA